MKIRTWADAALVAGGVAYAIGFVALLLARWAGLPELGQALLPLVVFTLLFLVLFGRLSHQPWYELDSGRRRRGARLAASFALSIGTLVVIWVVLPQLELDIPIAIYLLIGLGLLSEVAIDLPELRDHKIDDLL